MPNDEDVDGAVDIVPGANRLGALRRLGFVKLRIVTAITL